MAHLIDKDALVAKIKKIYYEDYKFLPSDIVESVRDFKDDLLSTLDDTLETKEVDLDNHTIMEEIRKYGCNPNEFDIAKHFFELGLKARNG